MKTARHNKIIELVEKNEIETQEELGELLKNAGYSVTQATISRDIRELKLTKVAIDLERQKYIVLREHNSEMNEKYARILRDSFISMAKAQNILVVKTVSGMAMAAAAALDALQVDGIVGSIAGDDTIMCAIRTEKETDEVMEKLHRLTGDKRIIEKE
ncbi:MAG: arginine repressor [Lachnospiraceae bacterium]|nr:arginine repressor [Lachnospiraceae bacterium]